MGWEKVRWVGMGVMFFDVTAGRKGDYYDHCLIRVKEMRQSIRI